MLRRQIYLYGLRRTKYEKRAIDWIKEQRQNEIRNLVEEYHRTEDLRLIEDIEATNEYYDDILKDLHTTSIILKAQNYS